VKKLLMVIEIESTDGSDLRAYTVGKCLIGVAHGYHEDSPKGCGVDGNGFRWTWTAHADAGVHATGPVPMLLHCPLCSARHIDEGEFATKSHHTHACQECGHVWRPAVVATVGVQFLPGFKNGAPS
jgi:rubredoxin